MLFNIKVRLVQLGKTQVSLIRLLNERGIKTNPAQLSNALNGYYTNKKANDIVSACHEIVTEWEDKAKESA
jgi:hypothetical protein